jgi:Domain of unknown function (DUF4129)
MFKFLTRFIFGLSFLLFSSEAVYCQSASSVIDSQQVESGVADSSYLPIAASPIMTPDLRQVPDSILKTYRSDPDFAYANDPAFWKELPPAERNLFERSIDLLSSPVVRTLIFIIFLLLIVYAIYRLARENSFTWFNRNIKRNKGELNTPEREGPDPIDLDDAIRRCREEGNFSLAVRYMYLKTIRMIFEKKDILVRTTSTNSEMAAAFQNPQQAKDFRFLATAYEYIFYGGFVPGAEQFSHLQEKFDDFNQTMLN